MLLTHRERFERRKGQRELSQERFRNGGRATPLPSPGVYAQHNAVDMPAVLPDGSPAEESVSRILSPRSVPPRLSKTTPSHLRLVLSSGDLTDRASGSYRTNGRGDDS
jgi:NADH-quinone oxidoreductase subunit J